MHLINIFLGDCQLSARMRHHVPSRCTMVRAVQLGVRGRSRVLKTRKEAESVTPNAEHHDQDSCTCNDKASDQRRTICIHSVMKGAGL